MSVLRRIYMLIRGPRSFEQYCERVAQYGCEGDSPVDLFPEYPKTVSAAPEVFRRKETVYLPEYDKIKHKYGLEKIAGEGTAFNKSIRLMEWLTLHTFYCGMLGLLKDNTLDILDYSVDKGFKKAINCRLKAVALSDMLLSLGVKAFAFAVVDKKGNNHFLVHTYCPELGKWVVFDPSFNAYFEDGNGNVLDAFGLRDVLKNGGNPEVCGYNFNGETEKYKQNYIDGFLRKCFEYICTSKDNTRDNKKPYFNLSTWDLLIEPIGDVSAKSIKLIKKLAKDTVFIGTDDFLCI